MRLRNGRRAARGLRWVAAGLLGAILATVALPARYTYPGNLSVTVEWRLPRRGATVVELPPLGEVEARTHALPVQLRIRLDRVEPDAVEAISRAGSPESYRTLQQQLVQFLSDSARRFALRQVALAGAGAAAGLRLAGAPGWAVPAAGGVAFAALFGGLAAGVAWQWNAASFEAPTYRGALEAAPQIVELARMGIQAVGDMGRRLQWSARELLALYQHLDRIPVHEDRGPQLVVAHVSDLHNNPAAFDLLSAVVRHFEVDAVVDTGDMLELGSSLEPILTQRIRDLRVPYLFVPGNHDTPRLVQVLGSLPNVRILDGHVVEVKGLRVFGMADPGAADDRPDALSDDQARQLAGRIRERLAGALEKPAHAAGSGWPADIVAVHNNVAGESVAPTLAQVVLFGHDHRASFRLVDGTAYVDAGSTGAAGLRGLQSGAPLTFTLALLRFDMGSGRPRLWAVDEVRLDAVSGEFSMERHLVLAEQGEKASSVEPMNGTGAGR
ncbi:metallophosphoesterase family protein [Carboxydochorda subterranea]|uniref:Metallophosphoesterase family protein n=1 Tax=Carboxydichorda subterranea TaxID=3109565 RepID=A0ABZ1C3B7_9FIRM|nr:metallophosphoesterase family protein [Limnochorda sp. L945t]WRP18583.1 metallophosphoesterase family protein [Limnochorda sp. L945t]